MLGHVVAVGGIPCPPERSLPFATLRDAVLASDLSTAGDEAPLRDAIHAASHDGDTLGGEVEVLVQGVPPGLGSHVHWDRNLDGRLAQALMSVQAIKGVAIGAGFDAARKRGSAVHDPITFDREAGTYPRPNRTMRAV